MAKEKSSNPVAAHAKAQKKATQKKTKLAVLKQRTERLAKRNPARLEKQIDELKRLEETSGSLRPRDKELLGTLERELGQVRRARERTQGGESGAGGGGAAGGERQSPRRGGDGQHGGAGKRRRVEGDGGESSETDDDVRRIPMPRDTPPPLPRRGREALVQKKTPPPAQITYSSAPVVRDLRKEATGQKFAPAQVRRNMDRAKGKGGLVDEEEWEKLEKGGYTGKKEEDGQNGTKGVTMEEVEDEDL